MKLGVKKDKCKWLEYVEARVRNPVQLNMLCFQRL